MCTNERNRKVEKNVRKWVSSTEGQEALQTAMREAECITKALEKEREIDPNTIFEPMTL